MQFQIEDIKKTLENYEILQNKIDEIIELHRKVNDCYYEVTNITVCNDGLLVDVEFYKWQDTNNSDFFIDFDLLTKTEAFEEFSADMNNKIELKIAATNQKIQNEKEKAIEAAMKLLKENGIEKF